MHLEEIIQGLLSGREVRTKDIVKHLEELREIKKIDRKLSSGLELPCGRRFYPRELAKQRLLRGWSQIQLSKILGITQTTLSFWETGKRGPRVKYIMKFRELFGDNSFKIVTEFE